MPDNAIRGKALPSIPDLEAVWREHIQAINELRQTLADTQTAMLAAEARLHAHMDQLSAQLAKSQIAELEEQILQMRIEFDARLQVLEEELKVRSVGGES